MIQAPVYNFQKRRKKLHSWEYNNHCRNCAAQRRIQWNRVFYSLDNWATSITVHPECLGSGRLTEEDWLPM